MGARPARMDDPLGDAFVIEMGNFLDGGRNLLEGSDHARRF